jgi:hypothetical protein
MPFSKLQDRPEREDGEAVDKPAVMCRFSVSLVFQKVQGQSVSTEMRVAHLWSETKAEALGKAIYRVREDNPQLDDWGLALHVAMPFE